MKTSKKKYTLCLMACSLAMLTTPACSGEDKVEVDSDTYSTQSDGSTDSMGSGNTDSNSQSGTEDTTMDPTGTSSTDTGSTQQDDPLKSYPVISACQFPAQTATTVLVSSADESTGALGWIDPITKVVHPDLALIHTDTSLTHDATRAFVLNRYGGDSITVLARDANLTLLGQFSIQSPGDASSNPHGFVIDNQGLAHVALYGRDHLQVYDITTPNAAKLVRNVDLRAFADNDGIPEADSMIHCGDTYFVEIERLDRDNSWVPADSSYLVPVRIADGALYDYQGADGIPDGVLLQGAGISMLRADPRFSDQTHALALNTGIQSIDFANGTTQWVIPESIFEAQDLGRWDLRSFVVAEDGDTVWLLVIDDFPGHALWKTTLSSGGADLTRVLDGIESKSGSMERIGNELWVTDTREGMSGVRIFDIASGTPVEHDLSPIGVGLPAYGLHLID